MFLPSSLTRRALVVAVETYDAPGMNLANVNFDAHLLGMTLENLGWQVEVVWPSTLEDTRSAISGFAAAVSESGAACLLAFIGHGIETGGNIFLVPRDAKVGKEGCDSGQLLRFAEVQEMFAGRGGDACGGAEAMVFLLDCCRDDAVCVLVGKEGLKPVRREVANSIVIFSTSSGRTAGDGKAGTGGTFMKVFTEELGRPGQRLTEVTMSTRTRLWASARCQLAVDEVALTAHLYINQERPVISAETTLRVSKAARWAFQVREEAMGALDRWVRDEGDECQDKMLVHGMGGTGKTTLGKMFAARAASEGVREAVLFLTLSGGSFMEEYVEVAKMLGGEGGASGESVESMSEATLRAHVHGLLAGKKWKGKWLVVLDNLPGPGEEGAGWIGQEFPFESGKTLVTSRSREWALEGGEETWGRVPLQGMTEEEACGWVRRRFMAWEGDEEGVVELARKLGCLPLAIEQAAAFANAFFIESPARYLEEQVREMVGLGRVLI